MHKRSTSAVLIWAGLCFLLAAAIAKPGFDPENSKDFMIGIKIYAYQGSLPELFGEWRSLGVNAVFVSPALAAQGHFRKLAREQGISVFLILPIFFNPEELKRDDGLYALTDRGDQAREDWVEFVCPTRSDYRGRRVEWIKTLVRELDPDGISLDFIRYFVFWEMVYPERTLNSIADNCFDESCLSQFQKDTGIALPEGLKGAAEKAKWIQARQRREWTDWKCGIITGMVRSIVDEARAIKPNVLVNIHTVPWKAGDFEGAIRAIAGQDLSALGALTDMVSPMCYWHMLKQKPPWIREVVEDVHSQTRGRVVPSIQVGQAYISETLSVEEFKAALDSALSSPSGGVIFWNWDALAKEPEKKAVVAARHKAQNQ
jgi:hypothetical protein